MSRDLRST